MICSRCQRPAIVLWRDYRDLGVCNRCIYLGRYEAERAAFMRRWRALTRREGA